MRTIFTFIMIVCLLSACGASSDSRNTNEGAPSPSKQAEEVMTHSPEPQPAEVEKAVEAPETLNQAKDVYALIPSGWEVLDKDGPVIAQGDLNKDGIQDTAMIIEAQDKGGQEAPPRALLIAFGSSVGEFSLSILADQVILKSDEGGVWGDPLESLAIDRGSVVVSHYGGSNWRWYSKYRFRYQDGDWYLIGATKGESFTGDGSQREEDENLLTGDYIITTTDEKGKVTTEQGNRGKQGLIKLADFDIRNR
ncbi:hypothetical protein [Paenibacillus sp. PL2-23]|uniref:hypothetical protein n=1 Tax=Paenibacillus sp. PL2-23 TaxID=2100729 RepID=UPI0030FAD169